MFTNSTRLRVKKPRKLKLLLLTPRRKLDVLRVQLGADGELINEHRRDEIEAYARGTAGDSAEVLARIDAVTTARERIAANVPEQLALEAMMLALLPRRVRTPRRR